MATSRPQQHQNNNQIEPFRLAAVPTPGVSYAYDPVYPRVTTMTDGTGTTAYTYQPAGQLDAGQVATVDGPLPNDTITYTYDALGRVASRAVNGVALALTYDALGRVTQEANALGTFAYGYDGPTGRLATVTYPNGQTCAYSYLPAGQDHQLQTIHHRFPNATTLSRFDYTYDAVGNILTWQQQAGSGAPERWRYGYDRADQLTSALKEMTDPTPTVLQRLAYGYDPAGNRVFEQRDDSVTAWSHDALNRLVAQAGGGVLQVVGTVNEPATVTIQGQAATVSAANQFTGALPVVPGTNVFTIRATDPSGNAATATYEVDVTDAPKTFTYDANGNLTADGTRSFEWDARNQLVAWTENSHRMEYSYDGFGRRTYAKELSGTATVAEKRFVWCGSSPCEERQGPSWGSGKQFFSHGFSELGSQDFYVVDHLGSVREVTDPSGALVQRLAYDPWGRETLVFGTSITPFTYAEQMDFGGGVALAVHRAYSPEFGRWLSQDPMGLDDGPNMYAYVASNPVLWTDPLGLWKTGGPANPNTNTIVCDGSGNVTTQTNNTGTPQQTACLGKCFVTHERSHKEDVEVAWPGICKNKAAGTQVLYPNRDEQKWSEKKACRFELRCLRAALSASCGGSCDQIIRDRIKQMQTWCSQW